MEDAPVTTYRCHMCLRLVNPVTEDEILRCNFCQSGFVVSVISANRPQRTRPRYLIINSYNRRVRFPQDSIDRTSALSGSLGDYSIGPGYETSLQRLNQYDMNNQSGTLPATKEAVESLGMVKIEDPLLQCSVCLDDFEIGMEAKEMPCKHKFHSDCLLPWLELRSSCPVCRYLLPTADDDGEPKTDAETSSSDDNSDDDSSLILWSLVSNGSSPDSSSYNSSAN